VLFIAIKGYEWTSEIARGNTITSNEFFMFYYMLTGVHLFHVALGLVILGVVVRDLRNPRRRRMSMIESGATYWHMIDLDHPVRHHDSVVVAGTRALRGQCGGQRSDHPCSDTAGVRQGPVDHSVLHGGPHRTAPGWLKAFTDAWLAFLWVAILGIYPF
jgi:hypothetical protein